MAKTNAKQYAAKLLDQLIDLDQTLHRAFYEMGRILFCFKRDHLYDELGYESFKDMIHEELSFTSSTAHRYADTYRHFQRLHYSKKEALELINDFGWTHMTEILPSMKTKTGKRAIKNKIEANPIHQLNFMVDDQEYEEFLTATKILGGDFSEAGRLNNASEIFMEMVRIAKSQPKANAA